MLPYARQDIQQLDITAAVNALSGDLLTCGPHVISFENSLCEKLGATYAVACSSGTAALHLATMAAGVQAGDIGITSAITFLASANCIELCGGSADFVDIEPKSLCLDPAAVERYCRDICIPKVVVAVDFAGVPAAMEELKILSDRFGFVLIADCAHSLGSSYMLGDKEVFAGSCTSEAMAALSFHPLKNITTGEGGAVLTNSPKLAAHLRLLRAHGIVRDSELMESAHSPWRYEMHCLGLNYRLTDFQAAIGESQLSRLNSIKRFRQDLANRYNELLSNDRRFILPLQSTAHSPCLHLYPIQFADGPTTRLKCFEELRKRNIGTQVHYVPAYWQPYYRNKYGYRPGKCPRAETYYNRCLSLPLHSRMTLDDVDRIATILKTCA